MDVATYETTTPTVAVLAAAADGWPSDALGEDVDRQIVAGLDELSARLADGNVDCVLVGDGHSSSDPAPGAIAAAVRTIAADCPVVYAPTEPDSRGIVGLARESATYYLPRSHGSQEDLQELLRDAVATYDRHRQDARERSMFRDVLAEAPVSIYVKDAAARHVAVSSAAELATDERMIGKTDAELFEYAEEQGAGAERAGDEAPVEECPADETADDGADYVDDFEVLAGERIEDAEERVELEGGQPLWLRTTKVPRRNEEGEVVGLVGVTRDVTSEKKREAELERETRRLEQFASFASHDLRNPLTVARGNLELARETGDGEHFEQVESALSRMEHLIEDLLEIARPETEHEEAWLDLSAVVERSWSAVDAPAATIAIDLPDDLEIRAASGPFRQLLENVLHNAVDHGGSNVAVTVGRTATSFYVADDGPGVPADDRDAVFTYGHTTGGSGIGLAIAAEIADAHGWEPRVEESEAGGARLVFDRCLLRRRNAPAPVDGEPVPLGEWRTVGGPAVPGGVERTETDATPGEDAIATENTIAGEEAIPGEGVTIRGGGRALWGPIEEYATYATDVDGGVRIEARLTNVESVHDYSKAGLLLADASEPGNPLGFVGKTAEHGTEAAWRDEQGGPVETHQAEPDAVLPRWYRIDRLGDDVTVWASTDGDDWSMVDRHVLPLSEPVAVGLAVNSHEAGTTCEATFEAVRVVALSDADGSPPT